MQVPMRQVADLPWQSDDARRLEVLVMFPFPSRKITLQSPLSPREVETALQALTGEKRSRTFRDIFLGRRSERPFLGTVGSSTFLIQRNINCRNSFLPQLHGRVTSGPHGSTISVHMRLAFWVELYLAVWIGLVAFVMVPATVRGVYVPHVMVVFGLALPHIGFWSSARWAEWMLVEALKAQRDTPTT